ncbi:methyl-directed DNA mismatch repair protein [Chlamydia felis Fe/C-56]|uniref:DNA mismatch repair protein MutL n=1 Tax=Chlamydia felis (strain Fe/C-56) TaxID=264202 RepID=MUTL_CHLFF|nr:DNA mismatch repair endonuclease MutL [Chlamydia felis]Q256F3.1 RecName: Full=DNA mismatch repair protein MutL [Chlamydia felis Fe/C-56]BAE80835.1 methyl-directed DNA mismatch repair protein [Chlamydia felis Fe/C-56]
MPSRPLIQLLDTTTINQIAAGEVIENSISVVKELVENALDAGADEIEVETLGGGQGLIVVKDNGCGMSAEDVTLALKRHATSKIGEFSDIFSLSSFGFRGEALPAIASISKMEILSCPRIGEGSRTIIHGGEIIASEAKPRQLGTTISIDSLFYNVPVRRGFQKSPQADRIAMRKLLENRILSIEGVGWSWVSERQQEFHILKHRGFAERVGFVMGEGFMQEALRVDSGERPVCVRGFLGSPGFHRPTRSGQRVFINDRPVDSVFISKQIREAYSMLLPPQRHPVFVLKLYLPPEWCDFNVHPQKTEVRILKEEFVGEFLSESIGEVLARPQESSVSEKTIFSLPALRFFDEHLAERSSVEPLESISLPELSIPPKVPLPFLDKGQDIPTTDGQMQIDWGVSQEVRFLTSLGKIVLAEDSEGVHAIFTEAARKHLFYLALTENQQYNYKSQSFLVPLCLEVTPQEGIFLSSHVEDFKQLGIELSQMGPCIFAIDSAPTFIGEEELKSWILFLAAESHAKVDRKAVALLIKETLTQTVFCKTLRPFDISWLSLLWQIGKPEKAFDGTQIRRLVLDEDFIKE